MFSFKSENRYDDMEMNSLNELKIPPAEECCYTSCYCEENVWKLCEYVKTHHYSLLPACYAVFISNRNQSDYHVIFIYSPSNDEGTTVYDFDSILPFPVVLEKYAPLTFQSDGCLQPMHHRYFRVISAEDFLQKFASDRSRMKKPDGSWIKEPPPYPCLSTSESTNNIDDFISMDPSVGIGEVMNLYRFLEKFL